MPSTLFSTDVSLFLFSMGHCSGECVALRVEKWENGEMCPTNLPEMPCQNHVRRHPWCCVLVTCPALQPPTRVTGLFSTAPVTKVTTLMGKEKPGNRSTTYKWGHRLCLLSEWLGVWLQRLPGRREWPTMSWSVGGTVRQREGAQDGVRRWHALGHGSVSSGETPTFSNPLVSSHVNWKITIPTPSKEESVKINCKTVKAFCKLLNCTTLDSSIYCGRR